MPLLKRKQHDVTKWPTDLKPDELVYHVRFTREVFRDYQEYLNCMNLYRKRIWTCKVTGKTNLTYEEALVSERKATEKVLSFPKEFMGPVLHMVQFSVLRIDELVDRIYKAFKDQYVLGEEVLGIRGDFQFPCRIVRAMSEPGSDNPQYEVTWLDGDGKRGDTTLESVNNLMRKKHPFTRALLKAFIRESATSASTRNAPWSVQDKLARRYKISLEPVEESEEDECEDGPLQRADRHKRSKVEGMENGGHNTRKRQKRLDEKPKVSPSNATSKAAKLSYPIEDTLLKQSSEDSAFPERPVPSQDFALPLECIGILLMVWDFCVSFAKNLDLSPFSLEEFEKALDYREGDAPLLAETHFALLRTAFTDPGLREEMTKVKRKRKSEASLDTWKEDLCDFLAVAGSEELRSYGVAIQEKSYMHLKPLFKLEVLHELVNRALSSSLIREQLDLYIEEQNLIVIRRKDQGAVEQGKKNKEEHFKCKQTNAETGEDGGGEQKMNGDVECNGQDEVCRSDMNGSVEVFDDLEKPKAWQNKRKRRSNGKPPESAATTEPSEYSSTDQVMTSSKSRHAFLKQKVDKRLAEQNEKQKRLAEEQKRSHEKRKEQAEALAERKLHEQKQADKQTRKEGSDLDKRTIRSTPLGKDRNHNRYWFFSKEGRIFVESNDSATWGYYSGKEELDALVGWLNVKGIREKALHKQLETHYAKLSTAMHKRTKELAQRLTVEEAALRRSMRVRSAPRPTGFLAYVNRYRSN